MRLIGISLMLSFYGHFDAASENIKSEQNVFMEEMKLITWNKQSNNITFNSEVILSTPDMIRKAGYPAESHAIKTEDGYFLMLHRIPGGKDSLPVLLVHGVFTSSADWIIPGKGKALAYLLADQGYDVWLGNFRGNRYSRGHISLSPLNKTYWDFSFNEYGIYDLPAMITYITNMKSQSLHTYIGHSMGTTTFYIMASERPEIARMVQMMIGFAPVAFVDHMRSILQYVAPFWREIQGIMDYFFYGEFLNNGFYRYVMKLVNQTSIMQEICVNAIFSICGYNYEQFNYTLIPDILGHNPAGGSAKTWSHYSQIHQSKSFRQFDYGRAKNLLIYHSAEPPEYDLRNITVPIALFCGKNDLMVDLADVKRLYNLLPNVIDFYEVPLPDFNHVDFMLAKDAPKLVYERVFKIMRREIIPNNVTSIK